MRGDNDRQALVCKAPQQLRKLPAPLGVQVRGRLVEKERTGVLGNNHGQVGALQLAAGDVREGPVPKLPHSRELHGLAHEAAIPLAQGPHGAKRGKATVAGQGVDVHARAPQLLRQVGQVPGALPVAKATELRAVQKDAPAMREHARKAAKERGLAAAILSHQSAHLAVIELERVHGQRKAAVAHKREPLHTNHDASPPRPDATE